MKVFGYWDVGGQNDTSGGYYGRLWEIKTLPQAGGTALQDVRHTWDAGGNLTQRQDVLVSETENFGYDFLDRLTSVSGAYTQSYSYNQIGNITSMNGNSYTYGARPHAVTAVGAQSYTYDANGNITDRNGQTITWNADNKPVSVTNGSSTSTFVYDGDGNRVKKTEGGEITIYVNQYYEKNLTTGVVTTYYYLGGKQIAEREGTTLRYRDKLSGWGDYTYSFDHRGWYEKVGEYFFGDLFPKVPGMNKAHKDVLTDSASLSAIWNTIHGVWDTAGSRYS